MVVSLVMKPEAERGCARRGAKLNEAKRASGR